MFQAAGTSRPGHGWAARSVPPLRVGPGPEPRPCQRLVRRGQAPEVVGGTVARKKMRVSLSGKQIARVLNKGSGS